MRKMKLKSKYKFFLLLIIFILFLLFLIKFIFISKEDEVIINDNFDNMLVNEVKELCSKQKLNCKFIYQNNNKVPKDKVIRNIKDNNEYTIIISKGIIPKEVLEDNKVNELGKVPIMMYHGIVNTDKTKYVGGNVDRDGYNRTADAFRKDLEFYYQNKYRMIRLIDYVNGEIDVPLGCSPLILTFDDGNKNNFNVLGVDEKGNLEIDPNCAVGILEEFKKKYPDFQVTATFFLMDNLFNQKEYNEKIMLWLISHGYDIGNHTINHANFTKIGKDRTQEVVGLMYQRLESILKDKYVPIIALPYGSPYKKTHPNYPYIIKGNYNGYDYDTLALLRVGWDSEVSPFDNRFDKTFLKRCRAYDNNGQEFDISMVFKMLEKTRFISDGDSKIITIKESYSNKLNENITKEIRKY